MHTLLRTLTQAACAVLGGMGGALAQASPVTAHAQDFHLPYNVGTGMELTATDSTPGGPYPISYTIATQPAHGEVAKGSAPEAAAYKPNPGYVGTDSFTFTASTANGISAPATITFIIAPPVPIEAFDDSFGVAFNSTTNLFLRGRNTNAGSNPRVYFEPVTLPAHGSAVFGEYNVVAYTPTPGYAGPDSFTFRVRHGEWGPSNIATASITVAAAAPPVTKPGSAYVSHGTPTPIALVALEPNAGGPFALAYTVATPPTHGSVAINGSTATYTPASGYWGPDSFAFTATSANGTAAPATVRLTVGQPIVLGLGSTLGDTGQTQCTDSAGGAITCAALTAHPGQDGRFGRDAQARAPAFDYLPLGGGCVQDRVTGLIWSAETLNMPWVAVPAYSRCGIDTGWRLPTRRELLSIVHHGAANPAIDTAAFPGTQNAPYWSADADAASAWLVDFADGATRRDAKTANHAARLVAQPVNQAPTFTLGADEIVLSNNAMPGPRSYPGWATGITPGPAREAGQQLIATVRLLPVPGVKMLEFDEAPTLDPATGELRFTVLHRIYPEGVLAGQDVYYWTSSAGRVRVEVTLQDDGGTAGGGADTTVKSFEIAVQHVPTADEVNIKHPWKAACIPVTLSAHDIDTDPKINALYPLRYAPLFKIKEHPTEGYLVDYVGVSKSLAAPSPNARIRKSISKPLGDTVDSVEHMGASGSNAPVPGPVSPRGFFATTICYVPISSTYTGPDTFTYTAVDVDGNESAPASVAIEIYETQ